MGDECGKVLWEMAAGHDENGWERLGKDAMAAPGRRNGMARLRMQASGLCRRGRFENSEERGLMAERQDLER